MYSRQTGVRTLPATAVIERWQTFRSLATRARALMAPPGAGRLMVLVVLASAYFVPRGISWNADTHLYLTASIVDRGSLNLDPYASATGDIAYAHGHYFADKAPGLSLLAVLPYLLLKYTLLGGQPLLAMMQGTPEQQLTFLPRFVLAVVLAGVPTGVVAILLRALYQRQGVAAGWSAALALLYAFGTMALPFAGQLFSHQLAAALVLGSFVVLLRTRRGELGPRFGLLAGLLLGYAIITEYPTALLAGALGLYALTACPSPRQVTLWLGLGALPPLLLGALYNMLTFGAPLALGYSHLAGPTTFRVGQSQGLLGVTTPHLDALWQTTFGPHRGIFLLSPVLVLAIPGFLLLLRRQAWRPEARLALGAVLLYALFAVSYFAWDGGYSLGPRQFLPALPFLLLPLGELVRPGRARGWNVAVVVLSLLSVVIVGLATAVGPLVDPRFASPLTQWVLPLLAGLAPDPALPVVPSGALLAALWRSAPFFMQARLENNWGQLFGLPGLTQLLPLGVALGATLLWPHRHRRVQTALLGAEAGAGEQAGAGSAYNTATAP